MRVRLMGRRRDERGAVAAVVVLLAVMLLVLSGFTLDFGQAWMAKRNLQKAADAGALAAAQALSRFPGDCKTVSENPVALAAAAAAADKYRAKNRESYLPASTKLTFHVGCNAAETSVEVTYALKGESPSNFGPLAGGKDTLTTDRQSKAVLEVGPYAGTAMRPLAMCSTQLTGGPYVRLDYPKEAPPQCGNAAGAWWTVDCPGAPSNSTAVMVQQVRNGCPKGASVVTGQAPTQTTGQLTNTLTAACNGTVTSEGACLESNPGNLDSGQVADSWEYLVNQQTSVVFPVFCAPPQCSSTTIDGQGNNATFPVYKLVSAILCGYHFSKQERYVPKTGDCADMPTMYTAAEWDSQSSNFLIIKYAPISTSGSHQTAECPIGDLKCDGGVRRTRLSE